MCHHNTFLYLYSSCFSIFFSSFGSFVRPSQGPPRHVAAAQSPNRAYRSHCLISAVQRYHRHFFDKATTNCHNVYPVWRSESASIRREARKSSRYLQMCCIFNVLFKCREIRTLRTSAAIVFPFPAMDVAALGSGLDGHWGLKSQGGAYMKMASCRQITENKELDRSSQFFVWLYNRAFSSFGLIPALKLYPFETAPPESNMSCHATKKRESSEDQEQARTKQRALECKCAKELNGITWSIPAA